MPAKPAEIPQAVMAGIVRYATQHGSRNNPSQEGAVLDEVVNGLQWDFMCGCYFFVRNGMYHGVELDGHIHT